MQTLAINHIRVITSAALAVATLVGTMAPSFAEPFRQAHPRRAEVLRRDNNINNRINRNYGRLGGHYGQLKHEDYAIRRQEQRDARINGGYITKGEQRQLNHEENRLNRQISRDK